MQTGAVLVESASTRTVAAGERADYWTELINSYHCRLGFAFPRGGDFDGRTALRRTGNYQLIGWQSDAVTYYRTAAHVRAESDDDYRLLLPTTGALTLWQQGGHAHLPGGVGCLVGIDRPFAFCQGDGTQGLLMTIPRREVEHCLGSTIAPAAPLDFRSGLGRVVADLAAGLFAERATLSRQQFDAVADRMVELLCMSIVGDRSSDSGRLADLETAVRQYVRDHAEHPDLSGASIAEALGWSLRQVQLALQHGGTTPRDLIREERLRLAHARLRNPAYRQWSITDLAHAIGFGSVSAFSTAFHRRFGASPRDIRQG